MLVVFIVTISPVYHQCPCTVKFQRTLAAWLPLRVDLEGGPQARKSLILRGQSSSSGTCCVLSFGPVTLLCVTVTHFYWMAQDRSLGLSQDEEGGGIRFSLETCSGLPQERGKTMGLELGFCV